MLNNGQWNDQYNSYSLEYIMEISDCLNVTQTAGPAPGSILPPGSSHTVSYLATDGCGNQAVCSFHINVNSIPVQTGICNSGGINSNCSYINAILFGSINNKSGDNGGYKDFTNICANVAPGQSYPLLLDPGFGHCPKQKVYWKVWIDYTLDGDFDDANEYVAYGCNQNVISGTLTMPYTLWTGQTTMRISAKLGGYPSSPCEIFNHGETEDYCINVIGGDLHDGEDVVDSRSRNEGDIGAILLTQSLEDHIVEIYPTPADRLVNIKFNNADNIQNAEIYSIEGKLVQKLNPQTDVEINTSGFNDGMYMLRVQYSDGQIKTEKIVIQH